MRLLSDFHANLNKEKVGSLYRPANGTEGDMFFGGECKGCVYQSDYEGICLTELLCFCLSEDDPGYPIELQYGKDGQPCCRRKALLKAGQIK